MPAERRLLAAVRALRPRMADLTRELVALPTENPPGRRAAACAATLARACRRIGLRADIVRPAGGDGRPSVVAWLGRGRRALYFHGHYDVVPASGPSQFSPRRRGEVIFGRGAADMKGGLAAMLAAVEALRDAAVPLDGRIGLVVVPDEETGGAAGSGALLASGLLGREGIGMLTPEPSGGVVWNASRGALTLRLTVLGRAAHVGLAHQGRNAFERMLELAGALVALRKEVEERRTRCAVRPAAAGRSILLVGGASGGGTGFNVVPASFSFTIDRRTNPEEDAAVERGRLFELFASFRRRGLPLHVELLQEGAPALFPEDGPVARALAGSIRSVTGRAARFEMCPGLLEIRFYGRAGVPAYAYGPGLLSVSHGPREHVRMARVHDCAAVYALTAARLLAPGGAAWRAGA